MIMGYDPEDPRLPSRSELAEDAYLDAQNAELKRRIVARILEHDIDLSDRLDILNVVCPTPWDWLHEGHETCKDRVESLLPAVASIIYRHTQ